MGSSRGMKRVRTAALMAATAISLAPATAQENITYTYDARGRLTNVNHGSTGPNAGVVANYTYDKAENRTNVTVTGTSVPLAPSFSVSGDTQMEGSNIGFVVTRSGLTTGTDTVQYSTADGTATDGADYTGVSTAQTLTFNPGVTSVSVPIATLTDNLVEGNESFTLSMSNPSTGATITTASATGTITDAAPRISINSVSANEGSSLTFTVTRAGSSSGAYTVDYATADGTATAGSDYTAISPAQTLTFGDGVTSQQITVSTLTDSVNETTPETMFVNLSNPSAGSSITTAQGAGTISDPLTVSINDVSAQEGKNTSFTVTLSAAASQPVTVQWATADGTATTSGNDYNSNSGQISFNPGQTSKQFSMGSKGDSTVEPDEYFYVNLTSVTGGGASIGDGQGVFTIVNDD